MNLQHELAADLARERFDITDDGIYFPRQSILAAGEYFDRINGGEWVRTPNLLPARYTGFVAKDNSFYRPIRDAGLATGKLLTQ